MLTLRIALIGRSGRQFNPFFWLVHNPFFVAECISRLNCLASINSERQVKVFLRTDLWHKSLQNVISDIMHGRGLTPIIRWDVKHLLWKLFVLVAKFLSDWSRRRHQPSCILKEYSLKSSNYPLCVSMIWRSMILVVRYQKMLLDLDEGSSYQINPGCRRMVLHFCRVYVWLNSI